MFGGHWRKFYKIGQEELATSQTLIAALSDQLMEYGKLIASLNKQIAEYEKLIAAQSALHQVDLTLVKALEGVITQQEILLETYRGTNPLHHRPL